VWTVGGQLSFETLGRRVVREARIGSPGEEEIRTWTQDVQASLDFTTRQSQ
jgi:hypothetical protein